MFFFIIVTHYFSYLMANGARDVFLFKSLTESFVLIVDLNDRYGTAQSVRGLGISQVIRLELVC
jgi:hypothetical protein